MEGKVLGPFDNIEDGLKALKDEKAVSKLFICTLEPVTPRILSYLLTF